MRTVFTTLFCFMLCATHASAQSPVAAARGEAPVASATVKNPVAAARGKAIDVSLGYSYLSHGESNSYRVGLNGGDTSFTLGTSRLGIRADWGYARAANVHGTGRHSDLLSYLAGPVFYPSRHRNFNTYIHALVGAARVSGPVPRNGGGFLLGGMGVGLRLGSWRRSGLQDFTVHGHSHWRGLYEDCVF